MTISGHFKVTIRFMGMRLGSGQEPLYGGCYAKEIVVVTPMIGFELHVIGGNGEFDYVVDQTVSFRMCGRVRDIEFITPRGSVIMENDRALRTVRLRL